MSGQGLDHCPQTASCLLLHAEEKGQEKPVGCGTPQASVILIALAFPVLQFFSCVGQRAVASFQLEVAPLGHLRLLGGECRSGQC